jgi:hypothetical protein
MDPEQGGEYYYTLGMKRRLGLFAGFIGRTAILRTEGIQSVDATL